MAEILGKKEISGKSLFYIHYEDCKLTYFTNKKFCMQEFELLSSTGFDITGKQRPFAIL